MNSDNSFYIGENRNDAEFLFLRIVIELKIHLTKFNMADLAACDGEETNLLSNEQTVDCDKTTNYRRLITGGVVLVFVDLLWVGSAELSDVCLVY